MATRLTHNIRNGMLALLTYSGGVHMRRTLFLRREPLVRVVVFHDVDDPQWFEEMISYLSAHTHVLTPEAFRQGAFDRNRLNVLITFDDGYASWITTCAPILRKYGMQAIFFINSGLLNVAMDEEKWVPYIRKHLKLQERRTPLTWEGAKALSVAGHTIGGHSKTHRRLAELDEETERREVMDDKMCIEEKLDVRIAFFAYPFGRSSDFTKRSMKIVGEAGYTHAFSTGAGFVKGNGDPYVIPRVCLEDGMTTKMLTWFIDGAYDMYSTLKNLCVR